MKAQRGSTNINYFYTSLTLAAREGLDGQRHAPAALSPEKIRITILQEAGWTPGTVWANTKNLADTGFRILYRTHRS